jgi:hypothetical protein
VFRCLRISSKLQLCDGRALALSRNGVGVWAGVLSGATRVSPKKFSFL